MMQSTMMRGRCVPGLGACETPHKSRRTARAASLLLAALAVLGAVSVAAARLHAQPEHQVEPSGHGVPTGEAQAVEGHGEAGHGEEGAHGDSVWTIVARLVNFGILAGALVYLLRSPLATYLSEKSATVRKELVDAQALRASAVAQLAEIEAQLKALPSEIDALKARGAQEIAAEEARIARAAETERERLLEQTRREIDLQLRIARRQLIADAAELAVGVASDRISRNITDQDQQRLINQYLDQVSRPHE
jgi:F-type H+-transporting ATPase subunit b